MIRRHPEPPATVRSFTSAWGELDYLCRKLHYWLYARKQKAGAERYLGRLERVLKDLPEDDLAIVREDALAILWELKGMTWKAIDHRRREIALMEKLHKEAHSRKYSDSTRAYMLQGRDSRALSERRQILGALEKIQHESRTARKAP